MHGQVLRVLDSLYTIDILCEMTRCYRKESCRNRVISKQIIVGYYAGNPNINYFGEVDESDEYVQVGLCSRCVITDLRGYIGKGKVFCL